MKELNKFIGIIRRCNLSKDEIVRTLEEISRRMDTISIDSWKGTSSFDIEEKEDKIIVIKYQKPEKGTEPKETKTEINITELKNLFSVLKEMSIEMREMKVKSRKLGESFYKLDWDTEIFCNRPLHNKFTIMLNVLEKKKLIDYRGGVVYLR